MLPANPDNGVPAHRTIAYFSMEIALDADIPTYSGGLGVLAADTIRSAANLKLPIVATTLLYRRGYFRQKIDSNGWQTEAPAEWNVAEKLEEQPQRVVVKIEDRDVHIRAWKYDVKSGGWTVPVFFLDTQLPENSEWDRGLTDTLYGGDEHYRLCQEIVLGIGGVRFLRAWGCNNLKRFHMNEGHASLLVVELFGQAAQQAGRETPTNDDLETVRNQCVFTTHTPVPAGHDRFPIEMVRQALGRPELEPLAQYCCTDGMLNMTELALNTSRYVNGVAKKHAEVSRAMFTDHDIDAITNGVHAASWTAPAMQALFDRYIPGWREDNSSLRQAMNIPRHEIWEAHVTNKNQLLDHVNAATNAGLQPDAFTIGFARRAATYKRADLLIEDIPRLKRIAAKFGTLQVIYAGKAHSRDQSGKELIQRIVQARPALEPEVKLVYLEEYDTRQALLLTSGVDIWLNTPEPPLEASGTSGMKAALNGVPTLSILDGWWIEGWIEGQTGWAIGEPEENTNGHDRRTVDAEALYQKLELIVLPLFYQHREQFIRMMRYAIALNGSYFNTQRMALQYVLKAYFH
jgi:starch phosphorylase